MVDDENDHLGCYYLADKVKEEVFWLEDVDEAFMSNFENVSILSQEHLSKSSPPLLLLDLDLLRFVALIARHYYWYGGLARTASIR